MNNFANRLRELRTEKGLSAKAFGKAVGVSDATVIRWENGQNDIKSEQLISVAKFFAVSTDYLLGLED